jgi:hypothetical protein
VGLTVLPLLNPNREKLFASFNGGSLISLSAGAAVIPVPPPSDLQTCHVECSGDVTVPNDMQCCAAVIDIWLISHRSRTNTGCSLYFTVARHAAPASINPIFAFHGEINAGLQVSTLTLCAIP